MLKEYLRQGGYSQKQLAYQLSLHPTLLSNKLNEHNYSNLAYPEVKQIVKILAKWKVLTTRQEALALLSEMGLGSSSFSPSEWATSPLNLLLEAAPELALTNKALFPAPTRTKTSPTGTILEPVQPPLALANHFPIPPRQKIANNSVSTPLASSKMTLDTKTEERKECLGDAPSSEGELFGREAELEWLHQQLFGRKAKLMGLTGLGGIGKTALASRFAQTVKLHFDFVVWYSLHNAPSPETALAYLLNKLAQPDQFQPLPLPSSLAQLRPQLARLMQRLQQARCLLILDNFETVLASGKPTGSYLNGYEGYGLLLELVVQQPHQSCLLLTSREKPKELALLEKTYTSVVISLPLTGLGPEAGRKLLNGGDGSSPLKGSGSAWEQLVKYYQGNALALKLLKEPLQMIFGGSIEAFMAEKWGVFGDIRNLLEQQFGRLSPLEKQILYWVALERQALSLEELKADFCWPVSSKLLAEGVVSLGRRSLLELKEHHKAGYFWLQPVILEYLTERMVAEVVEELVNSEREEANTFLGNYALLKAETKDYIRQSQHKLIVLAVLDQLEIKLKSREAVRQRLWQLLEQARKRPVEEQGYEGGNLINLLVALKVDLSGADFSGLRIRQAYLQGIPLEGVNLAWSELGGCLFTNAFSGVESVAFSPDGSRLASGGLDGRVRLWEVSTGQCLEVLEGHRGRVWSVAFSPDGKLVASGSADRTIQVWQLDAPKHHTTFQGHTGEVLSVVFSPGGKLLASAGVDQTVRLWKVDNGQDLGVLTGHTSEIWSVAFSPDGQRLASGSADQTIRLWEPTSRQCLKLISGDINWVWSVAFSPDGSLLASGSSDYNVRLWEVASGKCLKILRGHTNRIYSVAFSPDGKLLASGSSDETIRLWNLASKECRSILQGHQNLIKSVSFSPDSQLLASGSPDQSIRLWEIEDGQCLRIFEGYSNRINSACYSPDGRFLASGSDDSTIRVWDLTSARLSQTLRSASFVKSLAFSPNGKLLASGGADSFIRLWDLATGKCLKILQGYPSWVWSLAFSPDGRFLVNGGNANNIYMWDIASGQCLYSLEGHTNFVKTVAFSPNGKLVASASSDHSIRLWDAPNGQCLKSFEGHTNQVWVVAFSPDGKWLASGSADQTIRLWEISSGRCFKTLQGHTNWVWTLAFSSEGSYLVSSGYDERLVVWDTNSWEYLFDLTGHSGIIRSLAFASGGGVLAGADENYLRVWDLQTRQVVQVMKNPGLYEGLNIYGVNGLSMVQEANLIALGAIKVS
jgi:WD40 repeat protein